MDYKNLVILGTSHIAKQSLKEVRESIKKEKPSIIALELDKSRMHALMSNAPKKVQWRNIRSIGLKAFIFSLIGAWAEKKLGKLVGVAPGSEMKLAIKLAKKEKIEIAMIDQDIAITLKRLSESITWREKWNFFADIAKALFRRKAEIEFDLSTVPDKEIIDKMVGKVRERYPSIYNVLIKERNTFIANNLRNLMLSRPDKKILAIVGAGHVDEVTANLKANDESEISYRFSIG